MKRVGLKPLLLLLLLVPSFYLFSKGNAHAQTPELLSPANGWTVDTLTPSFRWRSQGYTQLRVTRAGEGSPAIDVVLVPGVETYSVSPSASMAVGAQYRWKVRTNILRPETSPLTWGLWSEEWTFYTPQSASWASAALVQSLWPTGGTVASSITPTLSWTYPPGATNFELIITPDGNERGRTSITRPIASSFTIPGPPQWYSMLPGTLYYWRVRVTNTPSLASSDAASWGPWSSVAAFRTPVASGDALSPATPDASKATSLTPTLAWKSGDPNLFYFEIQLSKDPGFVTDPSMATSMVYWETRHGGLTTPPNSYTVPKEYPLQPNSTYYWRVRPMAFGAPVSVPWSRTWSFTTPAN